MKKLIFYILFLSNIICHNCFASEPKLLSHIDSDYIFTYYYSYVDMGEPMIYYKSFRFDGEQTLDNGNTYIQFCECNEDGSIDEASRNVYALLRESDNRVFMLLGSGHTPSWYGEVYGYFDKETMIYDYNLKLGDSMCIGSESDYIPLPNSVDKYTINDWIMEQISECAPYTYLSLWHNGEMTLTDIRHDNQLNREVMVMRQQYRIFPFHTSCFDRVDYDTDGYRSFEIVDGFGCMQSLLAFPGLFPPLINISNGMFGGLNPILAKVTDINTNNIIYEKTDLPSWSSISSYKFDDDVVPEYYNIQGMRVANPAEGEIYIVKRGIRASKEVYRR